MGDKVGENPAAMRAAVFLLSSKNLRGGVQTLPPPSRARVKYLPNGLSWDPEIFRRFLKQIWAYSLKILS